MSYDPEELAGVLGGSLGHLLLAEVQSPGQAFDHEPDIGGLVALAAFGMRSKVGAIGLDEQTVQRHAPNDLR
jgi:hypothetical protein